MHACVHASMHMSRSESQSWSLYVFPYESWDQIQVIRLHGKHLYLLSHPVSPKCSFLFFLFFCLPPSLHPPVSCSRVCREVSMWRLE